jgi:RDD family
VASSVGTRLEGVAALPTRALGAFVDSIVVALIVLPVTLLVHPVWFAGSIAIAVSSMYQIPQIAVWGMTLGARAVGVQVTNSGGQPPGWIRAAARWATLGLIGNSDRLVAAGRIRTLAGLLLTVAVYAPALFDPKRRALTDRVAGTLVLDRARRGLPTELVLAGGYQVPLSPAEQATLNQERARGLALVIVVMLVVSSSLAWWTWTVSRADHQAQQQAVALESVLKGLKPSQILLDPSRLLTPRLNFFSASGDANHVVIQVQPRSLPHIRCVVANLDAAGHYDVIIKKSRCRVG